MDFGALAPTAHSGEPHSSATTAAWNTLAAAGYFSAGFFSSASSAMYGPSR